MKNIIIYNKINIDKFGGRRNDHVIENYLKAQIENSLYYKWDIKDIIVATNFPFEYMGIKNLNLNDICEFSGFNNKWFGIREIFKNHFKEDCWLHDYDNWQINELKFPTFDGNIAGCTYVFTEEWNTASLFLKKDCEIYLDYVFDFLNINNKIQFDSDENAIAIIRRVDEVKNAFCTIDNKYNIGLTKLEHRYNAATKPVCTLGVKLLHKDEYTTFKNKYDRYNLIPDHLNEIIHKYTN